MRISCDLFTHAVLWLSSQHYFAIAFEAYRPKLGKSLKKKILKGQSQQQKVFWLGVCTENASFRRHILRLEAILIFISLSAEINLDAIFSDCDKVLDKRYFAAQKGLI